LVQAQQKTEHVVIPDDKVPVRLSTAKDLINKALVGALHLRELQRQIGAGLPHGTCAPALLRLPTHDRARQQGVEGGADEELESFNGGERGKRDAWAQIGIFDEFVKTFVNALDRLPVPALSIDDFLKIARLVLERQGRIKVGRETLRE